MEEKKFDPYQFIGFVLIALILTWMLYRNQFQEGTVEGDTPTDTEEISNSVAQPATSASDSVQQQNRIASFGELADLMSHSEAAPVSLENEKMTMVINPKGGVVNSLQLKEFTNYLEESLHLIAEDNSRFNIRFFLKDGRQLNSEDFYFTPTVRQQSGGQELSLRARISDSQYVDFIYFLPKDSYIFNFSVKAVGLVAFFDTEKHPQLLWKTDVFRNSKSIEYENRYTELSYGYERDRMDYLSLSGEDEEQVNDVDWISYRQHFFSAILIPQAPIKAVDLQSKDLTGDDSPAEKFTKSFDSRFEMRYGEDYFSQQFQFYFGPTDYETLKSTDLGLEDSVRLGWGIFGWINRFVFLPLFGFLSSFLPHGIAIIVLTLIVRLAMSPVTYKSYVSQVKMKVLRPEMETINKSHKNDAAKRQQATMALYSKAGVNPLSGCIPALIQLPVFYALFTFFPVAFVLRQKSFLWADDLSSYDSVLELPFSIPFYGDHVSLFPILASIAIFFYTQMTMGQQTMPQQPGMPNMKIIMYIMPLMMLFFFNNYASGLSLYYFVSNLLTIVLMLVIKNYIIDQDKIHARIEENKKKPKKKSGFSARLQKAMEEAERQQKARQKKR